MLHFINFGGVCHANFTLSGRLTMTSLASDPEKVSPTAAFDKEEIASQRSERQPSLTFSEKSWKTILASCMPMAFICLLVWLDEAILATAIPRISDEFNSFDQIGWYGPSYLFGLCASQLPFGRAYKDFPSKITYLVSLGIFEIASIVQANLPQLSSLGEFLLVSADRLYLLAVSPYSLKRSPKPSFRI
jgi:hypothetical protein